MRGSVAEMAVPYSLGSLLPQALQDDPTAMRLTAGLDNVLAPIIATLDSLYCYVDPVLAPPDFLQLLADWVGMSLDESWPMERRREAVVRAIDLHRVRGTVDGLRQHLEIATGARVEVVDNGGVTWSTTPQEREHPLDPPELRVRVLVEPEARVDVIAVDELVAASKPAHVAHRVELVESS